MADRAQRNEILRNLRAARRTAGLCPCGRELAGKRFRTCRQCRHKQSNRQRTAYKPHPRQTPDEHRAAQRECMRRLRAKRRAAGQCIRCTRPTQSRRCPDCHFEDVKRHRP